MKIQKVYALKTILQIILVVYGKWLRIMNKVKKHKFLSIQIIHTIIENSGKARNSYYFL